MTIAVHWDVKQNKKMFVCFLVWRLTSIVCMCEKLGPEVTVMLEKNLEENLNIHKLL